MLPTLTWQAYNLRDGDGDGKGDSWYAEREANGSCSSDART